MVATCAESSTREVEEIHSKAAAERISDLHVYVYIYIHMCIDIYYIYIHLYIYIHNYLIISSYFIHRISGASETPALRDSPIGDQNAQRELNGHKNMPTMKENHNIWYVVTVLLY
jgi:hypothetical protein